jgi:hypothetical protein
MKSKTKYLIILLIIISTSKSLKSEEIKNETTIERKKIHIYLSPIFITNYTSFPFRKREERQTYTFLYGLSNNLFLGFNYSRGEDPNRNLRLSSRQAGNQVTIYEEKKSREAEYLTLKAQYFFYNNFYGSLNFGIEKGFTQDNSNFISVSSNSISLLPYSRTLIYSDRYFATAGIGYRKEVYGVLLLGLEWEYGYMSSGRINDHSTFNPEYFAGAPSMYLIEQLFKATSKSPDSSPFGLLYFYSGIAL